MKESTIENNINKSLNAIKIGELGHAKEYVNRILVEHPDNILASKIREYIAMLQDKNRGRYYTADFFMSLLKSPVVDEIIPLIEFLCNTIECSRLGETSIEHLIEEIENCGLENDVLNDFYNRLKLRYPIAKAESEKISREVEERETKEKIKKAVKIGLVIIVIVAVILIIKFKI